MPIRPEEMSKYPGGSTRSPEWQAIRAAVRLRSSDRCEKCKVPNHAAICRGTGAYAGTYMLERGDVFDLDGTRLGMARGSEYSTLGVTFVVLTVAHLYPDDLGTTDIDRLRHWCQLCHNRYDASARAAGRVHRAKARLAVGDLFEG